MSFLYVTTHLTELCTWSAGMSIHLTTFYRKEDSGDAGHTKLLEGAASSLCHVHNSCNHIRLLHRMG